MNSNSVRLEPKLLALCAVRSENRIARSFTLQLMGNLVGRVIGSIHLWFEKCNDWVDESASDRVIFY